MSWRVVARRDVVDPVRSRSAWAYAAVYVLLFGGLAYLGTPSGTLGAELANVAAFFVPLTALAAGYQSVVGSRQNGALRVTLSYPHTRREVVVGTAVGRAVVMASLVTVGYAAALLARSVDAGFPDLGAFAASWGLAALLAAAMASLAVGISAAVRTTNRAVVLAFGSFLLFLGLWSQIPGLVLYVLNGFSPPQGTLPEWVAVFGRLNPTAAFQTAVRRLLGDGATPEAFYATEWFSLLVLVGWLALPLAAGALRFERSGL